MRNLFLHIASDGKDYTSTYEYRERGPLQRCGYKLARDIINKLRRARLRHAGYQELCAPDEIDGAGISKYAEIFELVALSR
jgi:hypothetical protein